MFYKYGLITKLEHFVWILSWLQKDEVISVM